MEFIQHTVNWVKGEIFEALIYGSFGLVIIIFSFLFWKFGVTPNSKAVVIPFAIIGIFFFGIAISGIIENKKRLIQYKESYQLDNFEFVKKEKKRVEEFQYLYKTTIIIASVSFAIATCFFIFTNNHILRAIGLALITFGLTGLIIDYFSKERADIYYSNILKAYKSKSH